MEVKPIRFFDRHIDIRGIHVAVFACVAHIIYVNMFVWVAVSVLSGLLATPERHTLH